MKSSWIHVLSLALLSVVLWALPADAAAQSTPASTDDTEAASQDETGEGEDEDKKIPIGLYVEIGIGTADIEDLDTTLRTAAGMSSVNDFDLVDMDYRQAAVGWKLPENKGRFRVVWTGINETGYDFTAVGRDARAASGGAPVVEELDWWLVNVTDGALTAERQVPIWTTADDLNMDGNVQADEVNYFTNFTNAISIEPNMQNRTQHVDLLFGNAFGPRRVEGVWWGGMRYFAYEGTLLQGAWLQSQSSLGTGFTDGAYLRLIHASQETTAIGPTGSLGIQVNFFDKRFQMFADGAFAFTLSDVEVDTGTFVTLTRGNQVGTILAGPSRLNQTRDRTSWHTHIQAGLRLTLKNGLSFEATYYQGGFLDAVLTPTEIRIPQGAQELANGASAIYATQDLRYDGWRSSISYQF